MSDVEALFHQVFIWPSDCKALSLLWWPDRNLNNQPEEYQMMVRLFGDTPSQAAQTLHRREQQKPTEDNKEDFDPLTLKLWSAVIIIMQQLVHQEGHLSLNLSWINQSAHLDQNRFNLTLHQQAWWKKVQRYRLINFTKFSSTISSPHECEEGEIYYLISYV